MAFARMLSASAAAAGLALCAGGVNAATLTGDITADNEFQVYISTNPNTLGTEIGSGANWQQAFPISAALTPGQTYYLQVIADNFGGPATTDNPDALLASLSVTGATFANGSTTLVTDTTDWTASPNGVEQLPSSNPSWTNPTGTPVSEGTNGGSNIWTSVNGGPISGIPTNAQWIWSSTDPSGEAFFSTTITASAVPEPSAWLLLVGGVFGVGAFMRGSRRAPGAQAA
jgi:hypothetical protein